MDLKKLIKSVAMLLLVGSTFLFSSPMVQKAASTMESNPNTEIGITKQVEKQEIVFWTFILSALGASTYLLIRIFSMMSKFRWDKFSETILDHAKIWHMG